MPLFYPPTVIHAILLVHLFNASRKCVVVYNTTARTFAGVLCVLWITSYIQRLIHNPARHGCEKSDHTFWQL